jgi:hypothetical protein
MIRLKLLLLLILIGSFSFAADIRSDFHKGMFEEDKLTNLSESKTYGNSNLAKAYQGLSKTMLADYMFLPTSKLSYFNDGKALIEKAIKNEPNNPEYRYLRLLVQLNAPFFLSYNSKIDSDVLFLCNNLVSFELSKYWKLKFVDNLLAAEALSENQELKLKAVKKKMS